MKLKLTTIMIYLITVFALHAQKKVIIDDVYITSMNFEEFEDYLYSSTFEQNEIYESPFIPSDSSTNTDTSGSYFSYQNSSNYELQPYNPFNYSLYDYPLAYYRMPYYLHQSYLHPFYTLNNQIYTYSIWGINNYNSLYTYNPTFNSLFYDEWTWNYPTPYCEYMYSFPYGYYYQPFFGCSYYLFNTYYTPISSTNELLRRAYRTPASNNSNPKRVNQAQISHERANNTRLPIDSEIKRENQKEYNNQRSYQENSTRSNPSNANSYTRSNTPRSSVQTQTYESDRESYSPQTYNSRSNTYPSTSSGSSRSTNSTPRSSGGRR